jgi:hypothetical protein
MFRGQLANIFLDVLLFRHCTETQLQRLKSRPR